MSWETTLDYQRTLRSKFCYKLTSHITDEQACLIEPMGVAHNILERIGVEGKELLVIGCGPGTSQGSRTNF